VLQKRRSVFIKLLGKTPHIDSEWIGSSPSMCEKTSFRSLKICFSSKPDFIPKGHKGSLQPSSSNPTKATKLHV
jgi:hypothetical protein